MKIGVMVEGRTEQAFKPTLVLFLTQCLPGKMPKLDFVPYDGRLPTGNRLKRDVLKLLKKADAVIALTDVYTGTNPPTFANAADAKQKMSQWVGECERFYPHAAQYDFEAWLLPFWDDIQVLAKHNKACPVGNPENVNHSNPPARRIKEIFQIGKSRQYSKVRDAARILRGKDLRVAANAAKSSRRFSIPSCNSRMGNRFLEARKWARCIE